MAGGLLVRRGLYVVVSRILYIVACLSAYLPICLYACMPVSINPSELIQSPTPLHPLAHNPPLLPPPSSLQPVSQSVGQLPKRGHPGTHTYSQHVTLHDGHAWGGRSYGLLRGVYGNV